MSIISFLSEYKGSYLAGDDIGLIWGKYLNRKVNHPKKRVFGLQKLEVPSLSTGQKICEFTDNFYSEYFRIYWNFPQGD